ncbi:hypothetical protein BOTBODRAFT_191077 [Botryobasidium botryosum FD-172 SS1]|uniref:MACPF-like domain-containing protein n=1 Tax=Botryobasidium botryosum (strain FD-172 SS1) TaxID=930990 RepID=A0A067MCZ1_BOTB1|nr:hypothetical protein BOTBODRAFT_191077 [Botryobasidium botryosum FD-172 SS1]
MSLFFDLKAEHQDAVLRNSNYLRGIRIHRNAHPEASSQNIASLRGSAGVVSDDLNNVKSGIEVISTSSERDFKYIQHGWTKASVAVQPPGIRVIAEPSKWEFPPAASGTGTGKLVYTTARYLIPRATIRMDVEDLRPTNGFVDSVNVALAQGDRASKLGELRRVFERWGHVITTRFEVGCSLVTTCTEIIPSMEEQQDVEETLQARLSALMRLVQPKDESDKPILLDLSAKGGHTDSLATMDIRSWLSSTGDPSLWRVIRVSEVAPTIDLLDAPLRTAINDLYPSPVYDLPSRISAWKTKCSVETPLNIDVSQSLTISAWVCSGDWNESRRCFLSLESPATPFSIIWLGSYCKDWEKDAPLYAFLAFDSTKEDQVVMNAEVAPQAVVRGAWTHIVFVQRWGEPQHRDKWMLYVNGTKTASKLISSPLPQLPNVSVVVGRGKYKGRKVHGWYGQVENVKVYQHVLSNDEIKAEGDPQRKPLPGDCSVEEQLQPQESRSQLSV